MGLYLLSFLRDPATRYGVVAGSGIEVPAELLRAVRRAVVCVLVARAGVDVRTGWLHVVLGAKVPGVVVGSGVGVRTNTNRGLPVRRGAGALAVILYGVDVLSMA